MSSEYTFLNMMADYEYLGFDALWSEFKKQYPNSRFPEDYARSRFEDMMKEGLEAAE
jgi:hypothetical protein